jgi:ubiquinone/menaquinone biosynthesis C-methylase UbiE
MNLAFKNWAAAYQQGRGNLWPNETLIRMVRGKYIPGMPRDLKGSKVLDVGCGKGTNLLLFASLGAQLYGSEVDDTILPIAKKNLADFGYSADIRRGENRKLDFPDNFFDFLVSWNVLHYENTRENILAGIAEYARVLKTGGRIFISTTGPKHMILRDAEPLGNHRYKIGDTGEFRKGEIYFYFETEEYLRECFERHFTDILIGRVSDWLFTAYQDYFILSAGKK